MFWVRLYTIHMHRTRQNVELDRQLDKELDTEFRPPDIEVAITVVLMALVVLLITLQQELILASVTYVPSVILATLCTIICRIALLLPSKHELTSRCIASLLSQCILMSTTLGCISAVSCHWFCFLRILPNSNSTQTDTMCTENSIDVWLLPFGLLFSGYTFLHLMYAIRIRSIIEPSIIRNTRD
jgi:D-alanyl-lipoteichoic acid acyltransferase DltB (MBOAT superfamily)